MHQETKNELLNIAKNLTILTIAIGVIPYLFARTEFSQFLPSIPKEVAFLIILAIPTLLIGWIALHVGLFTFKTLLPK